MATAVVDDADLDGIDAGGVDRDAARRGGTRHAERDEVIDVYRGDAAQDGRGARALRRDESGVHRQIVETNAGR